VLRKPDAELRLDGGRVDLPSLIRLERCRTGVDLLGDLPPRDRTPVLGDLLTQDEPGGLLADLGLEIALQVDLLLPVLIGAREVLRGERAYYEEQQGVRQGFPDCP
jgi:hypothetical protein